MHNQYAQVFVVLLGIFAVGLCGCDDAQVTVKRSNSTKTGTDKHRSITTGGNGVVIVNGEVISGGGPIVKGSGVSATEVREVGAFNKISVSTAVNVNIKVGGDQSVTVSSDDNIVPLVKTEVKNDVLSVYIDGSTQKTLPLNVEVVVPELTSLDASGSCELKANGVNSPAFEVELSGACSCTLVGKTDSFSCNVSGASKVVASELVAKNVKVIASGASHVKVFAEAAIDVGASGASSVQFAGEPSDVKRNKSGASSIKAL